MLYRVALQGFAEADRRSLASFLREAGQREPGYSLAQSFAEAELILADGDSPQIVADVVAECRTASTLFLAERRPAVAKSHLARPTDPERLLRGLDELVARLESGGRSPVAAEGPGAHADAKAAARRAARRARLAATTAAAASGQIPPDVLVLDPDDSARDRLCALLEHFGFCAYPARNVSQALWLLETRPFRATFLDVDLDDSADGAGIEVCQRVKNGSRLTIGPASALFIVSAKDQPVDRVRAALAGCDAFLIKPLARGDIARALESCGVPMPSDDRRY
jgi:CheY-like chemotaxis protein